MASSSSFDWVGITTALRATTGRSQVEFASLLGAAPSTISKWERGTTTPSITQREQIFRLAQTKGVDLSQWTHQDRAGAKRSAPRHLREALERFEQADWTFEDEKTAGGLHSLHPYPAKFIPHVPRQLLEILHPVVGGAVLDPFCGSGTTLLEAQRRGIDAVGIDLNPIACLISRVKSTRRLPSVAAEAARVVSMAKRGTERLDVEIPNLAHWFSPGAIAALERIVWVLSEAEMRSSVAIEPLRLCVSRIVVKVSRQESDTRYAAVERELKSDDVYEAFVRAAALFDLVMTKEVADFGLPTSTVHVHCADIMSVTPKLLGRRFGMVITSPPYPNAYEYWLYHKYRMYWLGYDPLSVKRAEIGARPHYFRKTPATPADFESQMRTLFGLFDGVLVKGGLACVVVGRSIIKGVEIDNAALMERAARAVGFKLLGRARRSIPDTRKAFNPIHGKVKQEHVLVFGRVG